MGSPKGHNMGDPGLPPEESESLTHDLDRHHLTRRQVLRSVDGLPELA